MAEEFLPQPLVALDLCNALRMAGWKPYERIVLEGKQYEMISYPFPSDRKDKIGIMLRDPEDPTTMFEYTIPNSVLRLHSSKTGE